ncbi:MAG TPA: Co2+/Mg2+ efflux protein ApaG [Caulobacteraceae bacterium]|nr:Co2+/Mg2+ efflux protein ApaG [Caulobacteraceae bacterium]
MTSSDSPVYEAVTQGVAVRVVVSFLPQQSDPPNRWFWAYMVEIENLGERTVQLVSRRWTITDALGRSEEVQGLGVVGEQPILRPGEKHQYTSGCPLPTPSGAMAGSYRMLVDGGEPFDAEIPAFSLELPGARAVLN